jgi:hypothetical protein
VAPKDKIRIYIDGESIELSEKRLTGAELRLLVEPPAATLWLDVADAQDHLVPTDGQIAVIRDMRFFTDRARTIFIDKKPYEVRSAVLTQAELRSVTTPPVPSNYDIWKDVPDDLDDPIETGEIVGIVPGDRFFTKKSPQHEIVVTVNRKTVIFDEEEQTGASIKAAAINQNVLIKPDFLLSRKVGPKYKPVDDDDFIRIRSEDEFRANDGDDNS